MGKLAGDAYVYYGGEEYAPGDELPSELSHLTVGYEGTPEDSEDQGGTTEGDDGVSGLTVPELREELDKLVPEGGEPLYTSGDRKDALVAKLKAARA